MENLHPEGIELGGLYHGIDDVASDVTYVKNDEKIIGKRSSYTGKMSLKDYETISVKSDINSQKDSHQHLILPKQPNKNGEVLLSSDKGAHEMIAIEEKDDIQEDVSLSTARITSMLGRRKGGSPERIIKYPGMDDQIKDMVTSSQVMQIKTVGSES